MSANFRFSQKYVVTSDASKYLKNAPMPSRVSVLVSKPSFRETFANKMKNPENRL